MPRNGSGVYLPPSPPVAENTTIESAVYNGFVADVTQDLNDPRPITSGGTGKDNARDALLALAGEIAKQQVVNYNSHPWVNGSYWALGTATGGPVDGAAFIGTYYENADASNAYVTAHNMTDTSVPGRTYIREKKAGVWGIWKLDGRTVIGNSEGIGVDIGDMFFGVTGTAPNSYFIVNNKADITGANLFTISRADGSMTGDGILKPGFISDYAGPNIPPGWLICDGQAVSRTTYAALFNAIGGYWGAGDGSTTFNVPNLQNRFRRHRGSLSGGLGNLQSPANLIHTHTGGGNTGNDSVNHSHTGSGTTGGMNANNPHNHGVSGGVWGGQSHRGISLNDIDTPFLADTIRIDARDINHGHDYSFTTSGVNTWHQHAYNFTTSYGSADDGNESRPYSATVYSCIKT